MQNQDLNRISRRLGHCMAEGERLVVIEPLDESAPIANFDAAVCGAGLLAFVRPAVLGEWPPCVPAAERAVYVLVTQLHPGIRIRVGVECVPVFTLN